jgi:uncharacterized membrane protein YidH (DUF202 family)
MKLVRRLVQQPSEVADPGGQGERTYLAWQRTALSFAAVGALLVHYGADAQQPVYSALGVFGLAVAAVLLGIAMPRYRHALPAARGERGAAMPLLILLTAVTSGVLSVGALLLAFGST